MHGPSSERKQHFIANLLTLRTLMIFVAGFALALFLSRTLPGATVFHPEGQVLRKDIVIIALNGTSVGIVQGLVTEKHVEFVGQSGVWDRELLNRAVELADQGNFRFALPARITYVLTPGGSPQAIRVEPRE
jgi:hypothetical protein